MASVPVGISKYRSIGIWFQKRASHFYVCQTDLEPNLFFMAYRIIISIIFCALSSTLFAQSLGDFKPKETSYGLKKIKKSSGANRIYIAGFDVNFQVYNEKQDYRQGGSMLGGGMRGDALAEVSVGLEGLSEQTVQEITDQLYKDYIERLKAKGLTIITADEAASIKAHEGFVRMQGGKISMAEVPGVMTCTPTGFEYFIKKVGKDGKEKKGGFLGTQSYMYPKLSNELGDAIIGSVDLTVLFISQQDGFKGNGAKIKVKTSLRLIGLEAVTMTSDAKIKMKGQNTITTVVSDVSFYHGKAGAGATSFYSGTMSKPLAINDVIEDQKIASFARGGTDAGTSTIYGTFYSVRNGKNANAKIINVDPDRYKNGVYSAALKFLSFHADSFLKSL